jgi:hypothetical protein
MDLERADQVEVLRNSACDEGEDLIDIPDGVDLVKRGGGGWVNGRSRNRRNCAYAGRSSAMSADESSPVITKVGVLRASHKIFLSLRVKFE